MDGIQDHGLSLEEPEEKKAETTATTQASAPAAQTQAQPPQAPFVPTPTPPMPQQPTPAAKMEVETSKDDVKANTYHPEKREFTFPEQKPPSSPLTKVLGLIAVLGALGAGGGYFYLTSMMEPDFVPKKPIIINQQLAGGVIKPPVQAQVPPQATVPAQSPAPQNGVAPVAPIAPLAPVPSDQMPPPMPAAAGSAVVAPSATAPVTPQPSGPDIVAAKPAATDVTAAPAATPVLDVTVPANATQAADKAAPVKTEAAKAETKTDAKDEVKGEVKAETKAADTKTADAKKLDEAKPSEIKAVEVAANKAVPAKADGKAPVLPSDGVKPASAAKDAKDAKDKKPELSTGEQAILENSAVLDSLPAPSGTVETGGKRVTDILAEKADIRPLPQRYVVVKKEREAKDADAQVIAARSALSQGRYSDALEMFSDLKAKHPQDERVLMGRAVAMQKLNKNTEALAAYEEILNINPKNLEALTNMLGILAVEDGDVALSSLLQLRDMYPYNAEITAQLGMIYGVKGDYKNAVQYLEMADGLKPNDANIMFNKAVAYDKSGDKDKAVEIYKRIMYMASSGELDRNFPIDAVQRRLSLVK